MSASHVPGGRSVRAADLHEEQVRAARMERARAHAESVADLAPGDRVTVRGGDPGTVEARDGDRVTVRFDRPRDIGWPRPAVEVETVRLSVVSRVGDA